MRFLATPLLGLTGSLLLLAAVGCNNEPLLDTGNRLEPDDFEDKDLVPDAIVDTHFQVGVPAVDVLWVVDNSRSMYEEQRALTNNFTSFMKFFSDSELDLDYHIGVVSTGYDSETERGQLMVGHDHRGDTIHWIDPEVRNSDEAFREMALLGTEGPMDEKGRAQVYTALQTLGDTTNQGFLRPDAYLSVIVLSDEDDFSGDIPVSEDQFIDWLRGLKDTPEQVSFSSIVAPEGDACPGLAPSTEYLGVTAAVGGVIHPICEPSWASIMEDLGMSAAGLRSEFALSQLPNEKTIEIFVREPRQPEKEVAIGLGVRYVRARNAVVFTDDPPGPNARVRISYEALDY